MGSRKGRSFSEGMCFMRNAFVVMHMWLGEDRL